MNAKPLSSSRRARITLSMLTVVGLVGGLLARADVAPAAVCQPVPGNTCPFWESHYDGGALSTDPSRPGSGDDIAVDMAAGGDSVFTTGRSRSNAGGDDWATVAYNADTGAQRWAAREDKSAFDRPYAIAVSPDGSRVAVTGEIHVEGQEREIFTVVYSSAGTKSWEKTEPVGPKVDRGRDVTFSPDGSLVIVTGESQRGSDAPADNWDAVTVAYDSETGERAWISRYDNPDTNSFDFGRAVDAEGDRVFVAGRSYVRPSGGSLNLEMLTLALDLESGGLLWDETYGAASNDEAFDLVALSDGSRVFVTGEVTADITTLAYAGATGERVWVQTEESADPNPSASAHGGGRAIALHPAESAVYVAGDRYVAGSELDITTIAYTAGGTLVGKTTETNAGNDFARDIVAGTVTSGTPTPGVRAFTTGEQQTSADGREIFVGSYDQNAQRQWTRTRGEERNDAAAAIAVLQRPGGTFAYSAGTDDTTVTNQDYDTAAYSAGALDPTPTPSSTVTSSPSPSPTVSGSPATSPSPSPTTSSTPSAAPPATGSPSPSSTPTATTSPSPTVTASPSQSPSPSPSTGPRPQDPACDDGQDNDGDGRIDFPDDPGCDGVTDTSEAEPPSTASDCGDVETDSTAARTGGGLVIGGTEGDDVLRGSDGDDLICGFGGNDVLRGGPGDDWIDAGAGKDAARGGGGADDIYGRSGHDVLIGGAGNDEIFGNRGHDGLRGGKGSDILRGSAGQDILRGGRGTDRLRGGGGADVLDGGGGSDTCAGGAGSNRFRNCG